MNTSKYKSVNDLLTFIDGNTYLHELKSVIFSDARTNGDIIGNPDRFQELLNKSRAFFCNFFGGDHSFHISQMPEEEKTDFKETVANEFTYWILSFIPEDKLSIEQAALKHAHKSAKANIELDRPSITISNISFQAGAEWQKKRFGRLMVLAFTAANELDSLGATFLCEDIKNELERLESES
jgi:hypothetical protein